MIRNYDDLSPLERLSLIDMSYSRINSYDLCKAKYFYSYITKSPRVFSAPAALGNIVHDVLEDHVETGESLDLKEMVTLFEQYRGVHDEEFKIEQELLDVGYEALSEFVDRHDGEDFDLIAKELPFSIVIGNAHTHGFIDRVDREPDGIRIIDYKTGKWEVAAKNIANDLQLGIYFLACSHLFPEINTFKVELYYLRSGKRKGHTFQRADVPEVEARVVDQIRGIVEDFYFHETHNERICSFCEHATTGVCKTGVKRRARWRK